MRTKIIGLAVMAVLAVCAAASASALAVPVEFLGETPNKFTSVEMKSATAVFNIKGNALKVICKKLGLGTGAGATITSKTGGTFDFLFTECKTNAAVTCTGLTDTTEGSILVTGTFVGRSKKAPELLALASLLLNEVHFACGATLVLIKGCVAGVIKKVSTTHYELGFAQIAAGEQSPLKVFNEAGTAEEECAMLTSVNGGAFEFASEVGEGLLLLEKAMELMS